MICKSKMYLLQLFLYVFIIPLQAESIIFEVDYSLKYKSIESVEERFWQGPFAVYRNPDPTQSELNFLIDFYFKNYYNRGYRGYLEQRRYTSRVFEPGINAKIRLKKLESNLYAGILKNISGNYTNNTGVYCTNCDTRTSELDPLKFSFRDTAYSFQGGFNRSIFGEENNIEKAKVNLRGSVLKTELAFKVYTNNSFSVLLGSGMYYNSVQLKVNKFYSYNMVPQHSLLNNNLFYMDSDGLLEREYWTGEIPLKINFRIENEFMNLNTSLFYLYGEGRFLTHSRAPGMPLYQRSESQVRGQGYGYELKLEKELTQKFKMGIEFSGKRFFAKGKDYMHGSYDFLLRAVQETYNIMDYANTPLVYQGIRENSMSIYLTREY